MHPSLLKNNTLPNRICPVRIHQSTLYKKARQSLSVGLFACFGMWFLLCKRQHDLVAAADELAHRCRLERLVADLCQIIELLAEHWHMFAAAMLQDKLHKRVVFVQDQRLVLQCDERKCRYSRRSHKEDRRRYL